MKLTKTQQKFEQARLMKKLNNINQTKWFWIVSGILLIWTIVYPIVAAIGLLACSENKNKYETQLLMLQ
jgi:hypothetical protein